MMYMLVLAIALAALWILWGMLELVAQMITYALTKGDHR